MHIRLATQNDLPALMALVRRVVPLMQAAGNLQWDDDYPNPTVLQRDLALDQLWIAELNQSIAGFAAITTEPEPEYAQAGLNIHEKAVVVHRLAVDPDLRRAGVARSLMSHAEIVAADHGIDVLRVDTNICNEATQRLFPILGYRLAGEISLASRPKLRFLCYEKRLPIG
jgi:N-acetylglutamate synthase-like GNAT family acetyltransferase